MNPLRIYKVVILEMVCWKEDCDSAFLSGGTSAIVGILGVPANLKMRAIINDFVWGLFRYSNDYIGYVWYFQLPYFTQKLRWTLSNFAIFNEPNFKDCPLEF